jgi:endoglucanase
MVDNLGSLIVTKKGKNTEPKIMIAAHMDEVGFMVPGKQKKGLLNFSS